MSRSRSRVVGAATVRRALVALLLVIAACSGSGRAASMASVSRPALAATPSGRAPTHPPRLLDSAPRPSAQQPAADPPPAAPAPEAQTAPAPGDAPHVKTEHLHRALRALELGQKGSTVRVLWLGDSHAAADYWPNAVRVRLQQRFGAGGPGFVHVGLDRYRHTGVVVERQGPWRVEPESPSARSQQGDGVYGLGGLRTVPMASGSRACVTLSRGAVRGRAHWTLFTRLDEELSGLTVRLGSTTRTLRHEPGATGPEPIGIDLVGEATDTLVVEAPVGRPRLFGVTVEGEEGGVVLDTLGINGARVQTPLAWTEPSWQSAVAVRAPDLVIIEYGTNEVFDALAPSRYQEQYETLLRRIARASPEAACLLVGPTAVGRGGTDAQQRAARIEAVQRSTADSWGCSFFSTALAMGGHDGYARWSELSPPLAARDGVHLTPAGYKVVGETMADMLLDQYQRFVDTE
jgi:lysophospholipase L1-like esterase